MVLALTLGGYGVEVDLPPDWLRGSGRFQPFQSTPVDAPVAVVRGAVLPETAVRPPGWHFQRGDMVHVWEESPGQYALWMDTPRADQTATPPELWLDTALRAVMAHCLAARQGLLVHSSGWLRDGRAAVFFGVSGAGKSTTVRPAGPGEYLCDDIIIVQREAAGWRAYGTPFHGSDGRPGSPAGAPLWGLFGIRKDPGPPRVERVEQLVAFQELMRCVLLPNPVPGDVRAVMATANALVAEGWVQRLWKDRDTDPWPAIRGAVRAGP